MNGYSVTGEPIRSAPGLPLVFLFRTQAERADFSAWLVKQLRNAIVHAYVTLSITNNGKVAFIHGHTVMDQRFTRLVNDFGRTGLPDPLGKH